MCGFIGVQEIQSFTSFTFMPHRVVWPLMDFVSFFFKDLPQPILNESPVFRELNRNVFPISRKKKRVLLDYFEEVRCLIFISRRLNGDGIKNSFNFLLPLPSLGRTLLVWVVAIVDTFPLKILHNETTVLKFCLFSFYRP